MPISIRDLSKKLADSYAGYIMTSAVGDVPFLIMLSYKGLDVQALYVNESVI